MVRKWPSDIMLDFAKILIPAGYLMDVIKIPFRHGKGVGHYTLDFAHPEAKVDIEIDETYHRRGKIPLRDKRRDEHVRAAGWKIIRIPVTKIDRILLDKRT